MLLTRTPGDQVSPKKNSKTISGFLIIGIACLISITKGLKGEKRLMAKVESMGVGAM